jgi:hypothetical protein
MSSSGAARAASGWPVKRYHEGAARQEAIALRPDFNYDPCAEGHSTDTYDVDLGHGQTRTECRRCGKDIRKRGRNDDDYFWL